MTPAIDALVAAGVAHLVLEYQHDPAAAAYGTEAAELLGLDPATVFKTLVVADPDGQLAVAVVPVNGTADLKAIARALQVKKVVMADATEAERSSGYVVGGISPLGQRRPLPTVVDATALELAQMHVSAGRRGLEVQLGATDLVALTKATVAPIGRPDTGVATRL